DDRAGERRRTHDAWGVLDRIPANAPSRHLRVGDGVRRLRERVPLDPLRGDPYVWARIQGATLTVSALLITDDGGYEVHVYDRTLIAGGLLLEHSRVRDGAVLQTVTGTLKRVR